MLISMLKQVMIYLHRVKKLSICFQVFAKDTVQNAVMNFYPVVPYLFILW